MTADSRSTSLPMGQIAVAQQQGVLRTLLGSCLGVALYDRKLKLAALAHIVLPQSSGPGHPPGKFADTAIPEMIRCMQERAAAETLRLSAKIAGGANMFGSTDSRNTIGVLNIEAVEQILGNLRIPVIGRHCGGEQGRRMMLDVANGMVTIDMVGAETFTI
ncbi:MAG: chemotaxis protein CheD [Planctomycetes bacterium]|nr:chemotaxis protein CheD [Planctomycetota bacterium]